MDYKSVQFAIAIYEEKKNIIYCFSKWLVINNTNFTKHSKRCLIKYEEKSNKHIE